MNMNFWFEEWFHRGVDLFYEKMPRSFPDREKLKKCKIISHRGEHDNKIVYENTIPAFDRVHEAGVWGIEFDIRWTRDLQPVVFHDRDLKRVYKSNTEISKVTLNELKTHCKLIPTLSEVIQKFGNKIHFMVEIKKEAYPDPEYQNNVLREIFQRLTPQVDFHFIALKPEMFMFINFVPSSTFVPSARLNVRQLSDLALMKSYGGIAGHYLLMNDSLLKKHHAQNQCVGTGYIRSKNSLFRELNRSVEWIFSNHAVKLQSICNSLLNSNN
jgi:glycerophosphoryl diester phosphodiesterase